MKVYVIDEGNPSLSGVYPYRFRSLANSTVGKWHERGRTKEKAQQEGEQHQAIMERLYPQLRDDYQGNMAILGKLSGG